MKRGVMMFTACCLAVGMTFTGASSVALAAKDTSLAGLNTKSEKEETTEEPQIVEGVAEDTSLNGQRAFAQCEEYVNIRTGADVESDVVGKVYNKGSVTIVGQEGDWYKVESGNATGYVKKEFFATGAEAEAIAAEVAYNVATVYSEALTVRSSANTESDSIGMVYESDELEVVDYEGDWMKVVTPDGMYGYVNAYYVGYDSYYPEAETLEEEQARLDREWLDYLAEQEAAAAAETYYYEEPVTYTYYDESAQQAAWDAEYQAQEAAQAATDAQANADAAYQTYLNAQAAADSATGYADEQAVYDSAAAAQQAYQDYLNAQSVADAQAQAQADAAAQAAAAQQAATESTYTYTETYTEPTYTDTSTSYSYDTSNVDAAWQAYLDAQATADAATQQADEQLVYSTAAAATAAYEAYLSAVAAADAAGVPTSAPESGTSYTEDTSSSQETSTPSYSSVGQQIADYACQFVGNPYVWGGSSLTNGADCSGFTMAVYSQFGIGLPHSAAAQSGYGTPVSLSDLQPGDLLFYNGSGGIGHVTMYIGNGQVVHASSSTTGIIISSVDYRTPCCATRLV